MQSQRADGTQFESLLLLLSRVYQSIFCLLKHPIELLQSFLVNLSFHANLNTLGNQEVWLSGLLQASIKQSSRPNCQIHLQNLCIIITAITNSFWVYFQSSVCWIICFWLNADRSYKNAVLCEKPHSQYVGVYCQAVQTSVMLKATLRCNVAQVVLLPKLPDKIIVLHQANQEICLHSKVRSRISLSFTYSRSFIKFCSYTSIVQMKQNLASWLLLWAFDACMGILWAVMNGSATFPLFLFLSVVVWVRERPLVRVKRWICSIISVSLWNWYISVCNWTCLIANDEKPLSENTG